MNLRLLVILELAAASLTGCVAHCPDTDASQETFAARWGRFQSWQPPHAQGRTVRYITGSIDKPPVIVLHEFPALSANCLAFAEKLSRQGFTVYVPVLFGNTQGVSNAGAGLATIVELSASTEWKVTFSEHKHSAITDWLRLLCRDVSERHQQKKIGVIGMCLTGSFPVALMSEPCVAAPVVAQPSTPIFAFTPEARKSLGISEEELAAARRRGIDVFGIRYDLDRVSRKENFKTLHDNLGDHFIDHSIRPAAYKEHNLKRNSHATFTHCVETPPAREAFKELVSFLQDRL